MAKADDDQNRVKNAENFDFHRLTEDLTHSITDKLYMEYSPEAKEKHDKNRGTDVDASNELAVDHIVKRIKDDVDARVVETISITIANQIKNELEDQYYPDAKSGEEKIDELVKKVRWLSFIGFIPLVLVILILSATIFVETADLVVHLTTYARSVFDKFMGTSHAIDTREDLNLVVATILSILDLLLLGSLVIMVTVGGYENTIARIGKAHNVPTWFGKLDIGQLKIKVAASIVIISSVHLLMAFMRLDINEAIAHPQSLMWTAIVHAVFVFSAIALALMERISKTASH